MSIDDELRAVLYEIELNKLKANELAKELQIIEVKTAELANAHETLKNLREVKNKNALTPVGGGCFVKTKIIDTNKVLLSFGANTFGDLPIEKAIDEINNRINTLNGEKNKIIKNIGNIERKIAELSEKAKKLNEELRREESEEVV